LPSALHTIVFRGLDGISTEVNELFAACRGTLTRLEFHHREFPLHIRYFQVVRISTCYNFPGVSEINLTNFDVLKELELSSYEIGKIPPILRTITSRVLKSIQFSLCVRGDGHQEVPEDPGKWALVDRELCALADRLQATQSSDRARLEVWLVHGRTGVGFQLMKVVRRLLPGSQKHSYISFT